MGRGARASAQVSASASAGSGRTTVAGSASASANENRSRSWVAGAGGGMSRSLGRIRCAVDVLGLEGTVVLGARGGAACGRGGAPWRFAGSLEGLRGGWVRVRAVERI